MCLQSTPLLKGSQLPGSRPGFSRQSHRFGGRKPSSSSKVWACASSGGNRNQDLPYRSEPTTRGHGKAPQVCWDSPQDKARTGPRYQEAGTKGGWPSIKVTLTRDRRGKEETDCLGAALTFLYQSRTPAEKLLGRGGGGGGGGESAKSEAQSLASATQLLPQAAPEAQAASLHRGRAESCPGRGRPPFLGDGEPVCTSGPAANHPQLLVPPSPSTLVLQSLALPTE